MGDIYTYSDWMDDKILIGKLIVAGQHSKAREHAQLVMLASDGNINQQACGMLFVLDVLTSPIMPVSSNSHERVV